MRPRGFTVLALVFGTAQIAMASFDLMLLPNFANKVQRYDPVNNVQLGNFVGGTSKSVLTTIDQATNSAFVYDSNVSRIRKFNYNTGEQQDPLLSGVTALALDYHAGTNKVFIVNPTQLGVWGQTSNSIFFLPQVSTGVTWLTGIINGNVYTGIGKNVSNQIVTESFNTTTLASLGTFASTQTVSNTSGMGKAGRVRQVGSSSDIITFTSISLAGTLQVNGLVVNNITNLVTGTVAVRTTSNAFSISNVLPAVVVGHSSYFMVGQDPTTTTLTKINQYDQQFSVTLADGLMQSNSLAMGTFTPGAYQVANVVAPEPGTMIALGLGLAALAKKKRAYSYI